MGITVVLKQPENSNSIDLVARGFVARRRVQKMRVEAEKQAKKMNELLAQISSLSVTYHGAQEKIISEDANIPKSKSYIY